MCGALTTLTGPESAGSDPDFKAPRLQLSLADFELLRRIGDGSYSHVVLARHRESGRQYALKVVDKQYILRHDVVRYIRSERALLDSLQHPGIAQLHFTFQDAYSLYLGLEYCPNGELYDQIRLRGQLPEPAAAAYAAEVVLMLEHLRQQAIVHRDLKPENLLLDVEGHLKLIDFGSAKRLEQQASAAVDGEAGDGDSAAAAGGGGGDGVAAGGDGAAAGGLAPAAADGGDGAAEGQGGGGGAEGGEEQPAGDSGASSDEEGEGEEEAEGGRPLGQRSKRAVSLVGTADYVSPEILNNQEVTCAADLWALGCVLYQMLTGRPPFKTPSEYLTFQRIVAAEYEVPEGLSEPAADLIRRLLQLDPAQRLGAADLGELRGHPFFAGIDWEHLRSQPAPEFVPDQDPAPSSGSSSFDWELQSLASALPRHSSANSRLDLE